MTSIADALRDYDFNLPLVDALNDPALSADRRALAAVSMRQGLDDAYLSAHELLEAMRTLETDQRLGVPAGASKGQDLIDALLVADGDDFQRRLFWILSERPIADAVCDLIWLSELLHGRARMYPAVVEAGASMPPIPGA